MHEKDIEYVHSQNPRAADAQDAGIKHSSKHLCLKQLSPLDNCRQINSRLKYQKATEPRLRRFH